MSVRIYEGIHIREARNYQDAKNSQLFSLLIILLVSIAQEMDRRSIKLWEFQDPQIHLSFLVIRKNYSLLIIVHFVYGVSLMATF